MPRGGNRPGAGRKPDPKSERQEKLRASEKRAGTPGAPAAKTSTAADQLGVRFGRLPRGGFTGRVPAWPLVSSATTDERKVWNQVWRTPQAAAWATEPWRHRTVALWVRSSVRCEEPDAPAAIITASIRLADQIGLTPAGLLANGWEIEEAPGTRAAVESVGPEPGASRPPAPLPAGVDPRDRLTVVRDGAGG
ncbi:MAG: hypothetical protein JWN67_5024 [Actinomycetia bacterium]|nr:hypothetical protein [Actinomycetes bacterium]